ncbi:MAG TPA: hypothetical protein VFQ53_28300 [Kofleriaceae bacterium]|nr:hypothetical protein [Kofleriaceae bacterium]
MKIWLVVAVASTIGCAKKRDDAPAQPGSGSASAVALDTPAQPPAAIDAAPAAAACSFAPVDPDPAKWTVDARHVGPFTPCKTDLDLAKLAVALPASEGYEIKRIVDASAPVVTYEVRRKGKLLLFAGTQADEGLVSVRILDKSIAAPHGVHVGDSFKKVRAALGELECAYAAAEGSESVTCWGKDDPKPGDTEHAGFHYGVAPRPTSSRERELLSKGEPPPPALIDKHAVADIIWLPGKS